MSAEKDICWLIEEFVESLRQNHKVCLTNVRIDWLERENRSADGLWKPRTKVTVGKIEFSAEQDRKAR